MTSRTHEARACSGTLGFDKILRLNRAARRCPERIAQLLSAATLIPCSASALAAAPVGGFDMTTGCLVVSGGAGWTEIALGVAASALVRDLVGSRTSGHIFDDAHGRPLVADEDARDYIDELIALNEGQRLPFAWHFGSLREGVFAEWADGGVPQNIALAQAGFVQPFEDEVKQALHRIEQRAASDWWAARLGIPTPTAIETIWEIARSFSWRGEENSSAGGDEPWTHAS